MATTEMDDADFYLLGFDRDRAQHEPFHRKKLGCRFHSIFFSAP